MSFAAKWLGEDKIFYEENRNDDDRLVVSRLCELLDEADFAVAHNGANFDFKQIRARALVNGIKPPSPFKTIDTYKIAKKEFGFPSNSLEYLTDVLGCKYKKGGHKRWIGNEPNVAMVIQIAEAVHNYHVELRSRKSRGEMFKQTKKQPQIAPIVVEKELHNLWQQEYKQQNAEKTEMPIQQQPLFDQSLVSEFIQHDDKPKVMHDGEIESSKPKPRTFEVKLFGIRLFTINY